ncbi:GlyGly-CTERM sorting domain-containing protein [Pseudoalteromonas gelatinilytica]|jgi:uncharacterized protein|nr:GlyGly-CTERM sorting domain-containing protein [Pseudoalteromonas profundi]
MGIQVCFKSVQIEESKDDDSGSFAWLSLLALPFALRRRMKK